MYQGHEQVYRSTIEQLAARGLTFAGRDLDILKEVLGSTYLSAAEKPIKQEGNYLCVLLNGHVLHAQALKVKDELLLLTPMYPIPLTMATEPPELEGDGEIWFNADGVLLPPLHDTKERRFCFSYAAGPYVGCRTLLISHGKQSSPAEQSAYENTLLAWAKVVWYMPISAPPHYTKAMVET